MRIPPCTALSLIFLVSAPVWAETLDIPLEVDGRDLTIDSTAAGTSVRLPGYRTSAPGGQPQLPTRTLRLALPAGVDAASLTWEVIDTAAPIAIGLPRTPLLTGRKLRWLCPWACPGAGALEAIGRDAATERLQIGRLGPLPVVTFTHQPLSLSADGTGALLHPRQILRLHFRAAAREDGRAPLWPALRERAASLVDNPQALPAPAPPPGPGDDGLVIITSESFRQASGALDDFVAAREEQGYAVTVITETDFDQIEGAFPNERPQRIRAWLQQNAGPLNLSNVLLLGNPDPEHGDVPMLKAWPYGPEGNEYLRYIPTDAYYADLSGDWDLDGDGLYAEYGDDRGPGGVDFIEELYVGRIPIYGSPATADGLLRRAMDYGRATRDTAWRRRILFPGSILFLENQDVYGAPRMEGGDVAETMKAEALAAGYEVTTMYERSGFRPSIYESDLPLTQEELISEWNRGYGIVFWFGHGSEDGAYRTIWNEDLNGDLMPNWNEMSSPAYAESVHFDRLPHDQPAFVFHGSCSNGTPENAANIAYTQLKSGSIACYASTRVALGSGGRGWEPDEHSADVFTQGYLVVTRLRQGQSAGRSLSESRALLTDDWWGEYAWHTKLATTLYGDPTLSLFNCQLDQDCDDGQACNGQETCLGQICQSGEAQDCAQLDDQCTSGSCDDTSGACLAIPLDEKDCDDGLFCTVADRCGGGACLGQARTCPSPEAPCQLAVCDEAARSCATVRAPDGAVCTSADHSGTCQQGLCQLPANEDCDCAHGPPGGGLMWMLMALLAWSGLGRRRGNGR